MRIVNRTTFLALPANTLFCLYGDGNGQGNDLGCLSVKHQSLETDWIESYTTWVSGNDSSEIFDAQERAEQGESVKLDMLCAGRNGMFDDEQLFMIYEIDDLMQLQSIVNESVKTYAQ
jgi:hypothetical protein